MDFSNSQNQNPSPKTPLGQTDDAGQSEPTKLPYRWGDKITSAISGIISRKKPAGPPGGFVPVGERKEVLPVSKEEAFPEKVPIAEAEPPKEVGPEVKDWLERLETGEEVQLPQPVIDDTTGQVIVDSSTPKQVEINLPLSEAEIQGGLHREIVESIRWLAEWCKRMLKIVGRKFLYKVKSESGE